ncbi:transglycosylase domain-containing protein, partial [Candidatus Gottesmanbacteria bacterium]|nr:transglycosylase domain-containing protein [Candidatus Gottesmanbacteria bacterium]
MNPYSLRLLKIKLFSHLTSITLITLGVLVFIAVILFFWYSRDLPSPDKIKRKTGFSTVLLDRTGKPIYDIYSDQNRIPISFTEIPDSLKKATIAIEDKNFYTHQGFDPKGILRSVFNIITFRGLQGGSTLTQQLVKNVLLSSERTLPRKIKEFILSVQIERKYSKDEILQMYLNEAPYGGTMWGIESAAEGYFGKHAKDLDFLESIILSGLPQRPSYYTPFGPSPKAYMIRAEEVLRRLREDNIITQSQEADYKRNLPNVKFISNSEQSRAWHFVEYVKKQLNEQFGDTLIDKSGLRITTTLDSELQSVTEKIVFEELEKLKGMSVGNGAEIVINPNTGEILSYIGSKEYNSKDEAFQGKFDVVSMGYRQPGSALKPITYAAAFNKGYTPSYLLMDVETRFHGGADNKDYVPKNYDNKFRGPVQLRFALANSINVPAVKLTALTGIKDILKTASDMGITTLSPTDDNVKRFGLSLTLGGGEVRLLDLASAYGVFATGGMRHDPIVILKITDSIGKTLYEYKPSIGKRVLNEDVSFLISDILSDNDSRKEVFGLNSYLYIPSHDVAVKTGTTDDKRDNWT